MYCQTLNENGKTYSSLYNKYYRHNACEQVDNGDYSSRKVNATKPWFGSQFALYRISGDGIYIKETFSSEEILLIPSNPEKGYVAIGSRWRFEIISTNKKLETPNSNYTNLLSIKLTSLSNPADSFTDHYQSGKGKVAVTKEGQLVMYLLNSMSQDGMRIVNRQLYYNEESAHTLNPNRVKIDSLSEISPIDFQKSFTLNDDCCVLYLETEGDEPKKLMDILQRVREEIGFDFTITFWVFIKWDGTLFRVDILETNLSDEHIGYLSDSIDWADIRGGPCTISGFPVSKGPTYRYLVRSTEKNSLDEND